MATKSTKKQNATKVKAVRHTLKDLAAKSAASVKGGAAKYEDITINCGAGMAKN
jgi:hypothetical protein